MAQEPDQIKSKSQGGMALPNFETGVWIYQGALLRLEEES